MRRLWPLWLLFVTSACDADHKNPISPEVAAEIAAKRARLASSPGDVNLRLALADTQLAAGQAFEAADHYQSIVDATPTESRARVGLVRAYRALGYLSQAFTQIRLCLERDSAEPECLLDGAELLRADGSQAGLQQSRIFYQRFLEFAPKHPRVAEVRRAVQQLDAQLGPAPTPPTGAGSQPAAAASQPAGAGGGAPAVGAGLIPEHKGKGDEDVGALNPFGVAIGKAMAAIGAQDADAAAAAFREALAVRPGDPGATAGLAETVFQQGKLDEAVDLAAKAYAADPNHLQARWVYGLVNLKAGKNIGAALEAWEALQASEPEFAAKMGVTRTLDAVKRMRSGQGTHPAPP